MSRLGGRAKLALGMVTKNEFAVYRQVGILNKWTT